MTSCREGRRPLPHHTHTEDPLFSDHRPKATWSHWGIVKGSHRNHSHVHPSLSGGAVHVCHLGAHHRGPARGWPGRTLTICPALRVPLGPVSAATVCAVAALAGARAAGWGLCTGSLRTQGRVHRHLPGLQGPSVSLDA